MPQCIICTEDLGSPSPSDSAYLDLTLGILDENGKSKVSATSCGHLFHSSCIAKWIESSNDRKECPICKKVINPGSIGTIYADWTSSINPQENLDDLEFSQSSFKMLEKEYLKAVQECSNLKSLSETQVQLINTAYNRVNELEAEIKKLQEICHNGEAQFIQLRFEREQILKKLDEVMNINTDLTRKEGALKIRLKEFSNLKIILEHQNEVNSNHELMNEFSLLSDSKKFSLFAASQKARNEAIKNSKRYKQTFESEQKEHTLTKIKLKETIIELNKLKRIQGNLEHGGTKTRARPASEVDTLLESSGSESFADDKKSINPFIKPFKRPVPSNAFPSILD